jgi:hypothetical protein
LEYILSLRDQYRDTSKLTESAKTFMNRAVIAVLRCLEIHHNNNKESSYRTGRYKVAVVSQNLGEKIVIVWVRYAALEWGGVGGTCVLSGNL